MFFKKSAAAIAAVTSLFLAVSAVSGCSGSASAANVNSGKDRLSIVCTIFPEYDWVKQIMGDKTKDADITYLLDSGIDLHNYQPTADDIIKISGCDMFLYVGGESDEWAEDAIKTASNKDMKALSLLEEMGDSAKTEEIKEGMEHEHEDDHDDDHDEDHDHEEEEEYDEHVWLSVRNAKVLCSKIADELCELDPTNASAYKTNLSAYSAKLDALDREFKAVADAASVKTVLFGDRFPFRYFVDDYGLDYYAAFVGCSAETEASFETIAFLTGKVDELGLKTIFTIENSDKSIAQTIINNSVSKDQTIAELNSLQSIGKDKVAEGATYISLMRSNLNVLKSTLK